jgi:NAD(P)-dependent dehydrogenase (short-subunit alcohol dehydrogenase family)
MASLSGRKVTVLGGSRGLGRVIVGAVHAAGADVLAVARNAGPLAQLASEWTGVRTLACDAADEAAPGRVFAAMIPDVLVICGGAPRVTAPLPELDWRAFSAVWDSDVKASFLFCKAALTRPLAPGATIILISSGAAIGGSPLSGGYAGAKRMQMFMANYAQKESDRRKLGLRFLALTPMRPMPDTEGGRAVVHAYAEYLGISGADFMKRMDSPQSAGDVARAVAVFAAAPPVGPDYVYLVSGDGVRPMP